MISPAEVNILQEQEMAFFLQRHTLKPKAEETSEITRRFAMNDVGRLLAAGMQDRTIRILSANNCEEIQCMEDDYLCTSLAFSPRGDILASGSVERVVKLWDIKTGDCLATFEGHEYPVLSLSFSPSGDKLVSSSGDTTLIVWDIDNREKIRQMKGHTLYVLSCDWDPSGNRIASGGVDALMCIWDANSGEKIQTIEQHRTAVHEVRFSPDGKILASGSSDLTIKLWKGNPELELDETLRGHSAEVRALAFSSDGKFLASGSSDKEIFVWSMEHRTIEGDTSTDGEIDGLDWYPNHKAFLSSDGSGAIIKWDLKLLRAVLKPFEDLLDEIKADEDGSRRDELIETLRNLQSRYDEETLRDKRVFYAVWKCKRALGLLKGKPRKR